MGDNRLDINSLPAGQYVLAIDGTEGRKTVQWSKK